MKVDEGSEQTAWPGSLSPLAVASPGREEGESRGQRIGARYETINEIGRGGFGAVYRALDRLTGRVVTIKRLRVTPRSDSTWAETRSVLAQEFRVLASLRHPNVITVFDYGFDERREPYLAMDLEENAQTILEAGRGAPLALQVDLIVQVARALFYMHRLGIIHRDLKPDNILVVRGAVKVLDFGLSLRRGPHSADVLDLAGTPAYMAPEVLRGDAPSERSDLYALGLVAYELFIGRYPFSSSEPFELQLQAERTALPRPDDPIDARLRPVLGKLLDQEPSRRYDSAATVIRDLGKALGHSYPAETVATRESFLQAAPFVGRAEELATLSAGLSEAAQGRGSTWLVAGESGVGKSRLLDELRTHGLVEGFVVVRGQAVDRGGSPYHMWRDIISNVLLHVDVSQVDAEILRAIVPDIGRLLDREVGEAPAVDPESAQSRLLICVESLLRRLQRPLLVLLEDIQWAGSESLRLLGWLSLPSDAAPALFVASLRDDEAPNLREAIGGAKLMKLGRLDAATSSALAEAMIGPSARRPGVLNFLERETEGIPFYIVEVVRSLAESSGALDRIDAATLPEHILPGGIQRIVRRRIDRIPPVALAPLQMAAVIGREIDAAVMSVVHSDLDVDEWAGSCERPAVLEVHDSRWRFAHDKLREQLLADLPSAARQDLHRVAAEAIERAHPGKDAYLAALAHHWRQAGDASREASYVRAAGLLALTNGANPEALVFLSRALELHRVAAAGDESAVTPRKRVSWLDPNSRVDPEDPRFQLALLEGWLSEAHYRLGDMTKCQEHGARSLAHFGCPVPESSAGWALAAFSEAVLRAVQALRQPRAADLVAARRVASEAARVQLRLTDVFFYSLRSVPILWSSLRVVNQCEPAGPSPELAQGYVILAILAGTARLRRLGDPWARRALSIARGTGIEHNVAWVQSRICAYQLPECRWREIDVAAAESAALGEKVGDLRLWAESLVVLGNSQLYRGGYERALALIAEALRLSRRSGNRQAECWSILCESGNLLRLGRTQESERLGLEGLVFTEETTMKSEAICALGVIALARLRNDDFAGAFDAARRAVEQTREIRPVAYWLQQPLAMTAETLLALAEIEWRDDAAGEGVVPLAKEALAALRLYARQLPLGRPFAHLWGGLFDWQAGNGRGAMRQWQRAVAQAERLETRYELARAHYEIGRHLPVEAEKRRAHLGWAEEMFEGLGCAVELAWIRNLNEECR